jgi:uncharacterized membrane-anchored protein
MRFFAGCVVALACWLGGIGAAAADQGSYPQTEEALDAAYGALHWQSTPREYQLPRSHAVIKLPSGYTLLLGADAERYSWLSSGIEFPDTEAIITYNSESASAEVYYEWRDEGYISDSDWDDVDPEALLQEYRDGTEAGNEERVANGFKPMHVVGWLEQPTYNKESRTVTYALELGDEEGTWVNAVALRLGRKGYTEFTWVGPVSAFKKAGSRPELLNLALAKHNFEEGHRYADFTDGDKVASYGIAGLVATALGAKFGKGIIAALIAGILAAKKVIIPIVLVAGAVIVKFGRRLFGRGDS